MTMSNALGVFPTGGAVPWPVIEDYSTNGVPWGPKKQGLGWAFQILPYMELEAVYGLCVQTRLEQCPIELSISALRAAPSRAIPIVRSAS